MAKRKLKQNQKAVDDETESQRPAKQFKKRYSSSTEINVKNVSSLKEEPDSCGESDVCILGETSGTAADGTHYESFSSFLKAFSYCCTDSDDEHQKFIDTSRNASAGYGNSVNISKRRMSHEKVSHPISSSHENVLNEESETNIRILSAPSQLSQIVLLQHPASLTLHGYVEVSVWLGSIRIFGYRVRESENIKVFSTESTGLKKIDTLKSKHKLEIEILKKRLKKVTSLENVNLEEFVEDIGPSSIVLVVKKILLPEPLQFLELYYPNALQTKWPRSETSEKEKNFELCSTQESYVIDVGGDFKTLSEKVNEILSEPVSDDADFGHRIFVRGDKNMGKSTLMRYLINSSLKKRDSAVYFLDTDPGQTEYTPPGVVSLFRVTKPLLGPSFAHQKKPLKMIYTGSINPGTSPEFYKTCIVRLVKYFNQKFPKETLFVNTMGWTQGVGELCLQSIKVAVKATIIIELTPPDPNCSLTLEAGENEITVFKVPSKAPSRESMTPSYSPTELRNFNIIAYFGQCQKPFLPVSLINSFHPVCVSWDKIALYVMGKKVQPHRLVEAIHCSIVALCRVDLSYVLKSDNSDFPMTLYDEPICECLGFGLVRATDETNHLFYIVTPLTLDQLENVNALIKGNIMIPDEIFLKQTIKNVPLPFTNHSQVAKTPGLKSVPKRAFRNTLTPNKNA